MNEQKYATKCALVIYEGPTKFISFNFNTTPFVQQANFFCLFNSVWRLPAEELFLSYIYLTKKINKKTLQMKTGRTDDMF